MIRYPHAETDPMADEMTALVDGTLQLEGNCLYLRRTGTEERYPILWPAGTTWDQTALSVVSPGGAAMPVGSNVNGGGGYLYVADVKRLAGPDAAARARSCVDNTYGEIAVVNNVESAIGPGTTPPTCAGCGVDESNVVPAPDLGVIADKDNLVAALLASGPLDNETPAAVAADRAPAQSICASIVQTTEPQAGTLIHEALATYNDETGVVLVFAQPDGGRQARFYGVHEADPATGGCPLRLKASL